MTDIQIRAKQAQIAENEAKEKARSNRANEELERKKIKKDYITGLGKGGATLLSKLPLFNSKDWYLKLKEISNSAGMLGFTDAYGEESVMNKTASALLPSVCVLRWIPTIGKALGKYKDPINVAAIRMYTEVTQGNSRNPGYEPSDLVKYLIAFDSIVSMLGEAEKVYGLLRKFSVLNRDIPRQIVRGCGYDYEDFKQHKVEFYGAINQYISQLASYAIPKDISYMIRHFWLNSKVFKDDQTEKSQMYTFALDDVYTYDEVTGVLLLVSKFGIRTGDVFTANVPYTYKLKYSEWVETMDELIRRFTHSQAIRILNADILKAYKESGLLYLNSMDIHYQTEFGFEKEVLDQIRNAVIVGRHSLTSNDSNNRQSFKIVDSPDDTQLLCYAGRATSGTFYQLDGYTNDELMHRPFTLYRVGTITPTATLVGAQAGFNLDVLPINIDKDNPDIGDSFTSTRLTATGGIVIDITTGTPLITNEFCLLEFGSEVITALQFPHKGYDKSGLVVDKDNVERYSGALSDTVDVYSHTICPQCLFFDNSSDMLTVNSLGESLLYTFFRKWFRFAPIAKLMFWDVTGDIGNNSHVIDVDGYGAIARVINGLTNYNIEMENFMFLDNNSISRLHNAALLSELAIPSAITSK